jgi:drug/metabolite transporter (DMT)-like permease
MPQFALLLTTFIWGATFPATKLVLEQVPPFTFLFMRFVLGCVLVAGVVLALRWALVQSRAVLVSSAIATVWLFLGYALQTVGLKWTTASNSAFITALYVVFVPLILRRFSRRVWVAAAVAVGGLWCLIRPTVALNMGDLATLGCAAAFAAHIACLERYTRAVSPASLFLWQLIFMVLVLAPVAALEQPQAAVFEPSPVLLVGLTITGVLATGAFAVQMWAQRLVPAHQVALLFSVEPAYAAWLAWYFLGESLDIQGWIGSALILAAVLIGTLGEPTPGHQPALQQELLA